MERSTLEGQNSLAAALTRIGYGRRGEGGMSAHLKWVMASGVMVCMMQALMTLTISPMDLPPDAAPPRECPCPWRKGA